MATSAASEFAKDANNNVNELAERITGLDIGQPF